MTDQNYRHVILVVDRSGSMASCADEATKAINSFVGDLKDAGKGHTTFTLRQFDNHHDTVHDFAELDSVPGYTLIPRGMTALNDAIGLALTEQGKRLEALPENQRPGRVQFVVMTDGYENASKEYTQEQIKQLIATQRDVYNWDILYLSADPTAQQQAQGYGIAAAQSAIYDTFRSGVTTTTTSNNLNTAWVTGQSASYSTADRGKMSDRTKLFDPDADDNS